MGQLLLLLVVALTVAAIIFGVTVLVSGSDPGLTPAEPDGRAVPLPADRPLGEEDVSRLRFDTALRGYRMAQVDQALRRAAYDIGYKGELIGVLQAEVAALREGRTEDAEALRRAREAALEPAAAGAAAEGRPVRGATDPQDAAATGTVIELDAPAAVPAVAGPVGAATSAPGRPGGAGGDPTAPAGAGTLDADATIPGPAAPRSATMPGSGADMAAPADRSAPADEIAVDRR